MRVGGRVKGVFILQRQEHREVALKGHLGKVYWEH